MTEAFDREMLRMAYDYSALHSTDPSTNNGAILFNPYCRQVMAKAANHFPDGVKETPERWKRPIKYSYVEHAERNVIFKAARFGVQVNGLIMYVPWYCCCDCARAIIQSGIEEVVGHQDINDKMTNEHPSWQDTVNLSYTMLTEAGIKFRHIKGKIFNDDEFKGVKFNGKIWIP